MYFMYCTGPYRMMTETQSVKPAILVKSIVVATSVPEKSGGNQERRFRDRRHTEWSNSEDGMDG